MADDIVPGLLEQIEKDFNNYLKENLRIKSVIEKINAGTATVKEAHDYSIEVGQALADCFKKNLSSKILPDGKMHYNIANRILNKTLSKNHKLISEVTSEVQKNLNIKAGIGIKPLVPELNQDKIDGIINRISSEADYDKASWVLDEPVKNFSQSVVDDSVKENAEFHYLSGLSPKIIRRSTGHCCEWCEEVAGTYNYPDVPKDVFRRHQRCECTVDYIPIKGKIQNVHSKKLIDHNEYEKKVAKLLDDKIVYSRDFVRKGFSDGTLKDKINHESQARHLEGANNDRSYIYGGEDNAILLYNKLKGTGQAVLDANGNWTNKERVRNDIPVGVHKGTGESRNAMIVYSKTGSHIYPRKEDDL